MRPFWCELGSGSVWNTPMTVVDYGTQFHQIPIVSGFSGLFTDMILLLPHSIFSTCICLGKTLLIGTIVVKLGDKSSNEIWYGLLCKQGNSNIMMATTNVMWREVAEFFCHCQMANFDRLSRFIEGNDEKQQHTHFGGELLKILNQTPGDLFWDNPLTTSQSEPHSMMMLTVSPLILALANSWLTCSIRMNEAFRLSSM